MTPMDDVNPEIEAILRAINEYNEANKSTPEEQIHFLHGSSSAVFAFIGQKVTIYPQKNESSEVTTAIIPPTLKPTGHLRKQYGIYPITGEASTGSFGINSRKTGVNYHSLSGMEASEQGVKVTYKYANGSKRITDPHLFQQRIEDLILRITPDNYIRNLKVLLMEATNLLLMEPNAKNQADYFLHLLKNEHNNLRKRFNDSPEQLAYIDKYFNKYIANITNILRGQTLPFISTESFQNDIINQYPIIFCASVTGESFKKGVSGEKIYSGEIPLTKVKMIFTPEENVENLISKLNISGSTQIMVRGYRTNPQVNKLPLDHIDLIECADFLQQASPTQFNEVLINITNSDSKIFDMLLKHYLDIFLDTKSNAQHKEQSFMMLTRMLKKVPQWDLIVNSGNELRGYVHEYSILRPKIAADPNYLATISNLVSADYVLKLQQINYLNAILECQSELGLKLEQGILWDYSVPLPKENLDEELTKLNDFTQLNVFYQMNKVFIEDLKNDPKNIYLENRLSLVRQKTDELIAKAGSQFINNLLQKYEQSTDYEFREFLDHSAALKNASNNRLAHWFNSEYIGHFEFLYNELKMGSKEPNIKDKISALTNAINEIMNNPNYSNKQIAIANVLKEAYKKEENNFPGFFTSNKSDAFVSYLNSNIKQASYPYLLGLYLRELYIKCPQNFPDQQRNPIMNLVPPTEFSNLFAPAKDLDHPVNDSPIGYSQ